MRAVRIAAIIVAVLLLDLFAFFAGRVVTLEANHMEITRALRAQSDAPTPEAQRRVDAAFATAHAVQTRGDCIAVGMAILITVRGSVAVKRHLDSRRVGRLGVQATNT
jgi:hypothetical protein